MKNFTKMITSILCCSVAIMGFNANAFQDIPDEGCYATVVVDFDQGLDKNDNPVDEDRSFETAALGAPDRSNAPGGFVSLGFGGTITLQFGGDLGGAVINGPGPDIKIWETSFVLDTCTDSNSETAFIEVSDGLTWVPIGEICRDAEIELDGIALPFVSQIRITDLEDSNNDGYDVDGVEALNGCMSMPEPNNPCSASVTIDYTPGTNSDGTPFMNEDRMDTDKALGEPQVDDTMNFLSLGYRGEAIFAFETAVLNIDGPDLEVVETTFGNQTFEEYPESADVYVSQNGVDFYLIGEVRTDEADLLDIDNAPIALSYITQVKIVDTTPEGSISDDGFDIDGISALSCGSVGDPDLSGCFAVDFMNYVEGTEKDGDDVAEIRTDPSMALGEPEGTDDFVFTTLGYGGEITLTFGGAVQNIPGPDLFFAETSFNKPLGCETYPEYAEVYVSADNITYYRAGTICKSENTIEISDADTPGGVDLPFVNFVKVVNNNELSTTNDGYDLDGVVALGTCNDFDIEAFLAEQAALLSANSEFGVDGQINLYPVPAKDRLNIQLSSKTTANASYEIVSIMGQSFNRGTANVNSGQTEISADISNLADGTYFLVLNVDGNTTTKQFVKVSR